MTWPWSHSYRLSANWNPCFQTKFSTLSPWFPLIRSQSESLTVILKLYCVNFFFFWYEWICVLTSEERCLTKVLCYGWAGWRSGLFTSQVLWALEKLWGLRFGQALVLPRCLLCACPLVLSLLPLMCLDICLSCTQRLFPEAVCVKYQHRLTGGGERGAGWGCPSLWSFFYFHETFLQLN